MNNAPHKALTATLSLLATFGLATFAVAEPPTTRAAAGKAEAAATFEAAAQQTHGVAGKVSGAATPLPSVQVYVYRLADLTLTRAVTDERGHFRFDALPAGLYRVIAHKPGFLPVVVRLTRATAEAYQFLELELATAPADAPKDDFWSLRSKVPPDVLREIQIAEIENSARVAAGSLVPVGSLDLLAEMSAMTGVDEMAGLGEGQVTRGAVDVVGNFRGLRLGLAGDYWQLQPDLSRGSADGSAEASALSLSLADGGDMSVLLSSRSNTLVAADHAAPVDFEHYRIAVSHAVGERGRSDFSAQYTSESNFHRQGWADPQAIPEASRSWRLEGTYTAELTERTSLQTGVRYRQRHSAFGLIDDAAPQERVDFFGRAGMQVQPSVLIEYGLYTTLRDGSVSLSPRGGVVVQLDPAWQLSAAGSYKVHEEGTAPPYDFTTSLAAATVGQGSEGCDQNEAQCYQVTLMHSKNDDEQLAFGATHREYDETQRLYFSNDLIDRYNSLFLVPGDEVPELQFAVSRRISPKVLTRLESNLAEGGGGVYYATDSGAYENQVRYLVTSLDTHFDGTATGLFIAFHHLEQELQAIDNNGREVPQLEVERLELMLTQDLNILAGMATDVALQLNMQLSRGTWPFLEAGDQNDRDELRKRLLGGIALRF